MTADRVPLMTVAETAARLHVSPMTVRRLIQRRELRAVRIGHLWRIEALSVEQLATPADPVSRSAASEKTAERDNGARSAAGGAALAADPAIGPAYRIFRRRAWEGGNP